MKYLSPLEKPALDQERREVLQQGALCVCEGYMTATLAIFFWLSSNPSKVEVWTSC